MDSYLEKEINRIFNEPLEDNYLCQIQLFLKENIEDLLEDVDKALKDNYYSLILYLSYYIYKDLKNGKIERIRHIPNDCPYDYSGEITKDGYKDASKVLMVELLEKYCLGYSEATYTSHCGLHYPTYGDRFNEIADEYAYNIINLSIEKCIHKGDLLLNDIFYDSDFYLEVRDLLYDNTQANSYFSFYSIDPFFYGDDYDNESDSEIEKEVEQEIGDDSFSLMEVHNDYEAYLHKEYLRKRKVEKENLINYKKQVNNLVRCAKEKCFSDMLFDDTYLLFSVLDFAQLWKKDRNIRPFSHSLSIEDFVDSF